MTIPAAFHEDRKHFNLFALNGEGDVTLWQGSTRSHTHTGQAARRFGPRRRPRRPSTAGRNDHDPRPLSLPQCRPRQARAHTARPPHSPTSRGRACPGTVARHAPTRRAPIGQRAACRRRAGRPGCSRPFPPPVRRRRTEMMAAGGGAARGGGAATTSTSFRRSGGSRLAAVPGTRPALRHGQLLLSCGVPSLDCVLGWWSGTRRRRPCGIPRPGRPCPQPPGRAVRGAGRGERGAGPSCQAAGAGRELWFGIEVLIRRESAVPRAGAQASSASFNWELISGWVRGETSQKE